MSESLLDYIKVCRGCFSSQDCIEIINFVDDDEWQNSLISDDLKESKLYSDKRLSKFIIISNNQKYKKIDQKIYSIVSKLVQKYIDDDSRMLNIIRDEGYTLLRYDKNDKFETHVDEGCNTPKRTLSLIILLNDNFEGGKLSFKDYTPNLGIGDVIIFPSNFMFSHGVEKVTSGSRYSIVSWFS